MHRQMKKDKVQSQTIAPVLYRQKEVIVCCAPMQKKNKFTFPPFKYNLTLEYLMLSTIPTFIFVSRLCLYSGDNQTERNVSIADATLPKFLRR